MSEKFVILVDSTCDIDEELQKEYDIEILPGHYVAPDGKEYFSYPNWNDFKREMDVHFSNPSMNNYWAPTIFQVFI